MLRGEAKPDLVRVWERCGFGIELGDDEADINEPWDWLFAAGGERPLLRLPTGLPPANRSCAVAVAIIKLYLHTYGEEALVKGIQNWPRIVAGLDLGREDVAAD